MTAPYTAYVGPDSALVELARADSYAATVHAAVAAVAATNGFGPSAHQWPDPGALVAYSLRVYCAAECALCGTVTRRPVYRPVGDELRAVCRECAG